MESIRAYLNSPMGPKTTHFWGSYGQLGICHLSTFKTPLSRDKEWRNALVPDLRPVNPPVKVRALLSEWGARGTSSSHFVVAHSR
ncbi:hypothetical protein RND71_012760 [Anisodus tanguticus]|uniref:Uncharacterized protein n=1 Tax=Anisodus tanguticus TaxID=243964 RepID=A0AAE1SDU7_9SOLA|nr:hypothetical protein RND71_012760 [Anisodus tanguticus]